MGDERLFDRELEDLPSELRWREWMLRVEAVIFASAEPVIRPPIGVGIVKKVTHDRRHVQSLQFLGGRHANNRRERGL